MIWVASSVGVAACAGASGSAGGSGAAAPAAPAGVTSATLAGKRCQGTRCACRPAGANQPEADPPGEGFKRFEIRMSAVGGRASLDGPSLGAMAAGEDETCFYVDLPGGSKHDFVFAARASNPDLGLSPVLRIAEYGPAGPWWYEVFAVECGGPTGKCDRAGAEDWKQAAQGKKRGRIDPCGSAVVTRIGWETSGGLGERDGGTFRDFTVSFSMEVKRFVTQFAPGSSSCVPK